PKQKQRNAAQDAEDNPEPPALSHSSLLTSEFLSQKPNPITDHQADSNASSAFTQVESAVDTWLRENPPMLGGLLLEDARRYEQWIEEADALRNAGKRDHAHQILNDLLQLHTETRYAKDAQMRLWCDELFLRIEESQA
ncbi:MAG: hypothetical protein AAGJ35_13680, partial [Myxococcota bacterium]